MNHFSPESKQAARVVILWCSAGWLLFLSAWVLVLMTHGRGLPGLHGPGTLGNFLFVVGVCFAGAAISAVVSAATALARFSRLSVIVRLVALAPLTGMVVLFVVRFVFWSG
jgi:hypothetical protein